jgi:cellulose biosynthesis protein BcsQ
MSVIMFLNPKGGVAKTTSAVAVAVAECLASEGYRTLLIDADHQCMAGELLLGEDFQLKYERARRNLHDLLAAMLDDEYIGDRFEVFVTRRASNIDEGLDRLTVLPCSIRIDDFSTNIAKARRGHRSNEEFLRLLDKRRAQLRRWAGAAFDYTVIDCPSSLAPRSGSCCPSPTATSCPASRTACRSAARFTWWTGSRATGTSWPAWARYGRCSASKKPCAARSSTWPVGGPTR